MSFFVPSLLLPTTCLIKFCRSLYHQAQNNLTLAICNPITLIWLLGFALSHFLLFAHKQAIFTPAKLSSHIGLWSPPGSVYCLSLEIFYINLYSTNDRQVNKKREQKELSKLIINITWITQSRSHKLDSYLYPWIQEQCSFWQIYFFGFIIILQFAI